MARYSLTIIVFIFCIVVNKEWRISALVRLIIVRLIAGSVSILLLIKAFFIAYIFAVLVFSQPIVEIPLKSLLVEESAHFLNYRLYHSDVLGSVIVQHQTVLHVLSSLEKRVFEILAFLSLMLIIVGVIAVLYLAILGVKWRYTVIMSMMFCILISSSILSALVLSMKIFWIDVLSFVVVMGMLWFISSRFYHLIVQSKKDILMVYASQTGSARQLALQFQKKASSLFEVRCISTVNVEQLCQYQQVCFVVSTYGAGDPPDSAQALMRELRNGCIKMDGLFPFFNILALGDRTYPTFCSFGHKLSALLDDIGFKNELPVQEVDRMDINSITYWWQQISRLIGDKNTDIEIDSAIFEVCSNRHLNALRSERAAHHIRLKSIDKIAYEAGDLIAIRPEISQTRCLQRITCLGWSGSELVQLHSRTMTLLDALMQLDWSYESAISPQALVDVLPPIHERLYSIASYNVHYVDLLVREHCREDGILGNCSNYLCRLLEGDKIKAQLRPHESFRLHQDLPLIMISAGTGIAPFRGFLEQKQQWQSHCEHWLIFGEQYEQHDDYFSEDFERFQANGLLTHVSKAWSQSEQTYVQMILEKEANRLQTWVQEKGAQIYLCGSRVGFGDSVLAQLKRILGEEQLRQCLHSDLY